MQLFINNWVATLTAPAAAAAPELVISPAKAAELVGLGSGDFYKATLARVVEGVEVAWEVVRVTHVAAGVLTVERGQEETEPLEWLVGELISVRLTAESIGGLTGAALLLRPAGETISALHLVYELDGQVHYLDYRDGEHINLLTGLSLTAGTAGQSIRIQDSGAVDDAGWSWTPGPIWLGAAGSLTQTPPADGFDVRVGAAVSATRITLNLQSPINLE